MQLIEVPAAWALPSDEDSGRTTGLNFSDVQRIMLQDHDPDKYQDRTEEEASEVWGTWELGRAFEMYDKAQIRGQGVTITDGVEHVLDGIILTPDGETPGERIWEWKLTWSSSRHDVQERHWYYFDQIRAYCHARGLTQATLRLCNVCGNYKPLYQPHRRQFDLTFTPRELREFWRVVLAHKDRAEKKQATLKEILSLQAEKLAKHDAKQARLRAKGRRL